MMVNIDFFKIKQILLKEYRSNGGKNVEDFVRGMTYLQDYITTIEEDRPLTEDIPLSEHNKLLCQLLLAREKRIKELEGIINQKQGMIRNWRKLNKTEKRMHKENELIQELEKKNEELILEIIQLKNV